MRPADTTPARPVSKRLNLSPFPETAQGAPFTDDDRLFGAGSPEKVLLCHPDRREREREVTRLRASGQVVMAVDSLDDTPYMAFDDLLHDIDVVRFNVSVLNLHAMKKLLHICRVREADGRRLALVCIDPEPGGDFYDYLGTIIRPDRIERTEDARISSLDRVRHCLRPGSWGLQITHRFWIPGTECTKGEEVFQISVFRDEAAIPQPLSTKLRLETDFLARHRMPQNASQLAASLRADDWVCAHGMNARGNLRFTCDFSRTSIKRDVWKIRNILAEGFRRLDIMLDPLEIVQGIPNGREVSYRLNPAIKPIWKHVEL